ncbi:non-canonical purine NTP pyrophosphatase [Thalassospira xianhensis]|uniref:Uncharacterized protein n=1 Tax=Thalassospira xianhensis MCCC 1A02616 TaxID=1177929 RepID=A0A367UDN8_9PROT|nr:non-canonical purine NTP pyrophosphatase [Thalassospira xianhensis]RCK06348.1 hypothetical protein TH5_09105 [Thalassospira xianhensis MCCC 1A02616]
MKENGNQPAATVTAWLENIGNYRFVTSNRHKIDELKTIKWPLGIEQGLDLPEIDGPPVEIAIYKAIAAGAGRIVEDSILLIDGKEVVDIKWSYRKVLGAILSDGQPHEIVWQSTMGLNDGERIFIFETQTECDLVSNPDTSLPNAIAFDPYLRPSGVELSFHELRGTGEREIFNPRSRNARKLLIGEHTLVRPINEVPEWNGAYQSASAEGRPVGSEKAF